MNSIKSKMAFKPIVTLSLLALAFILISCGSSSEPEVRSAEEVYNEGVEIFNDEEYLEAKRYFEIIRLQYPASQYADDAQYYLAEISFKREEYIIAAFNYNRVRSLYPGSEYVQESLFKTGLCYHELSPTYDRDQEYTKKAIDAFNLFQRLYPNDNLYAEAGKYIEELREKLAHREFFTADLYAKWGDVKASLVYYDGVINDYPDTPYYEPAYFGKILALVTLGRKEEALGLTDLYKKIFQTGDHLSEVNKLADDIRKK